MKHKFALALQYKGATVQDNLKLGQKVTVRSVGRGGSMTSSAASLNMTWSWGALSFPGPSKQQGFKTHAL